MLRAHIAEQDDCLAGVGYRAFSSEEGERLTREFEEMERREIGEGTCERFAAAVETLEAKDGVGGAWGQSLKDYRPTAWSSTAAGIQSP